MAMTMAERQQRYYRKNSAKRIAVALKWKRKHPRRNLLYAAKCRAKKKGLEFSITVEDIEWPTHCPILGLELVHFGKFNADNLASLDRIDNSLGYVPGNVAVISLRANKLKRDGTAAEFMAILRYMERSESHV